MTLSTLIRISLFALCITASAADARDQVRIVGSSTVLPYARIVGETFGKVYPQFKTPLIESGGSSAGLKEFCKGVGPDTIDIANSSRPIRSGEASFCAENGVTGIEEFNFGYDGIVFATSAETAGFDLTIEQLYQALAKELLVDGELVANPYQRWSEIDPSLPDIRIDAFIPGEKHGTREVLEDRIMSVGCMKSGTLAAWAEKLDAEEAEDRCVEVRRDGRAIGIAGDYTETLQRIQSNPGALGVFGLSFYENNVRQLNVAAIDGVEPSAATVASGAYPVSRPLFFYVKQAHLNVIPGLREYVDFFFSEDMVGAYSPLTEYGLVPVSARERRDIRAALAAEDAGMTYQDTDGRPQAAPGKNE
ncbi:phosphate ABC transporter substrate-binding protein (PhoT family) [Martelella mediterranea]|uniref:Phosphate ABC transporter substrate-binding protein (PhoT family) n=2 Tax=Martelella mediterranea TaxID=293089 RepID=A0A4R3P2Q3_9HYPH|nr:substrate-binding domain-containing protein [Martelella mediterranea]TCT41775.1 phosphate ABC transporter substrate-binding protein (PhoT family) [Martelella mediterranea]